MAEKTELLVVISLIVIIFIVIFFSLIPLAGTVQTLYCSNSMLNSYTFLAASNSNYINESFQVALALYMSFGVLGAPLSWGMSILSLFNSNWWLNGWMQLYLFYSLVNALL